MDSFASDIETNVTMRKVDPMTKKDENTRQRNHLLRVIILVSDLDHRTATRLPFFAYRLHEAQMKLIEVQYEPS